jgi:hypothetical protein
VIAHFNQSTDLLSLLEGYGARIVYQYAGGKALLHCAASHDHAHGDAHPSLIVEPGRGHQLGRMICGCYSPACRLHNQPGQVMDAFEVFCRLEGISKREGVQRIQSTNQRSQGSALQTPQRTMRSESSLATPPVTPHTSAHLAPGTPSERVIQQRLVEVNTDERVQPLDRRLLAYVISHDAHGQGLANAVLAAALGAAPDSIKRAKRRLRTLGYIDVTISTDGLSPSVISIISPIEQEMLPREGGSSEGGVQTPPPSMYLNLHVTGRLPPPSPRPPPPLRLRLQYHEGVPSLICIVGVVCYSVCCVPVPPNDSDWRLLPSLPPLNRRLVLVALR